MRTATIDDVIAYVRQNGCDDVQVDDVIAVFDEVLALRKQAIFDRQSREASQVEFARLNRELNEAKCQGDRLASAVETAHELNERLSVDIGVLDVESNDRIQVLLDEIADTAIAAGMMDPGQRGTIDGPNAIQFLRHMREQYERE